MLVNVEKYAVKSEEELKMREKLIRFMYGRYGVDRLSKHLTTGALVLTVLSMFVGIFLPVALLMMIWGYFRIFSKNHAARYKELCVYERFWGKVKKYPARWKYEMQQRKEYRIFQCPSCKQRIRIPKGRGQVEIRCQKCKTVFRKRT